ncbi:MAG TPA: glutamate 5-kinase [Oleiagrimonas sp.]|nr:glutamate 5-kinase [Oleiagrimonas sp.]
MISERTFREQPIPSWQRAVLKVGSSLLAGESGELSTQNVLGLAQFIASSHAEGREIILVSSGAVTAGRMLLASHGDVDASHAARQAMAALGQTQTIALWQRLFDRPLAQVLLTHDDMRNRRRYLNARATLQELLQHEVLPVVNENDTVAVDELTLGDNDNLAAIVAALVDADLLLIATDIDGLYSANPRSDPDARPIDEVIELTPEVMAMAGAAGSSHGTGGMRTKLEAAQKAAGAGIDTILFNGRNADIARLLSHGKVRGTRLRSTSSKLQARKYWLRHMPAVPGCIRVDAGAARALGVGGASLLPTGVVGAEGEFQRGDMVEIVNADDSLCIARGITQYGAAEVNIIHGCHTSEIESRLGYSYGDSVVHRDDLATVGGSHDTHAEGDQAHD